METFWYPAYGHPDGHSERPWFETTQGWAYRTEHHRDGVSELPLFRVVGQLGQPMLGHPFDTEPLFEIIGSFVRAGDTRTLYQIK